MQKLKDLFKPKPKVTQEVKSEADQMSKHDKKKHKQQKAKQQDNVVPELRLPPPLPPTPETVKHVSVVKAKIEETTIVEGAKKPVVVVEQPAIIQAVAQVKPVIVAKPVEPAVTADVKPEPIIAADNKQMTARAAIESKPSVVQVAPEKNQPLTQAEYDALMTAIEKYIMDGSLPEGSLDRLKQRAVHLSNPEKEKLLAGIRTDLVDSKKIEGIDNPAKYGLCLFGAVSGAIVLTGLLSQYIEDNLKAGVVATAATLAGAKAYSISQTNSVVDTRVSRYKFFQGVLHVPHDITAANTAAPRNKM